MPKLIIVESPGKIDKIEKILGNEYKVVASFGHIRDLDPKTMSIDIKNNFEPMYIIPPDKSKVVQNLRYHANLCDEVIIASDLDREGEMIGCSIMEVLKLKDPKRIVFNEITKNAILKAIESPGKISMDMVHAQQTRRLLDRLVGYKISPLLWKTLQGKLSAGRVQSVVARIIVDLENEIIAYQSNPYFKVSGNFTHNTTDITCVLMKGKETYRLETKEEAEKLLNSINKKTVSIITNVTESKSSRSPPPPHITSSLMQEASTRYGMNSKKTMDIAQKLYEGGYITYMRTDSTILSKEAVSDVKNYIETNYGTNYYKFRSHKTNSVDAQEAHEAIRPTKIECTMVENMSEDYNRLYGLIWKRTVACLMADTLVNIMTIEIDCLNDKHSIFVNISDEMLKFRTNFETILFDGYMTLYNNMEKEKIPNDVDSENEIQQKKEMIDITKDVVVDFNKMDISEEYSKPPLRYNEAGLIKYLKKNGIGRPSTYASIIGKIVERNYVEIKNIEGVKKDIIIRTITNKTYGKIKEKSKTITIGKENMKIIPTEMGFTVTEFMMKNFEPIMDIKFTAELEKMLDKVANGMMKWFNVLDIYYKLFSPMVEVLEQQTQHITKLKTEDKMLGNHPITNQPIFLTKSKYGWCVKIMENEKWRYASTDDNNDVTLENAIQFLEYPKTLGKLGTTVITLNKGKYGLYFKVGAKIIGIKDNTIEPTLEYAITLAEQEHDSTVFKIKNKIVHLKNGQYGYYLMIMNGTKKPTNIPIPKNVDINNITSKIVNDIIEKNKSKITKKN